MSSLVSIIIPTKNSAATLSACIASIRAQSYSNIECLVVDNFSSDTTMLCAQEQGVRAVSGGNERSAQRNTGAKLSNGKYLLFIDSDMELGRDVVSNCVHTMNIQKNIRAIVIPEESFGEGFWAQCKRFERSTYHNISWMHAARFYRVRAYEKSGAFDENLSGVEDFDIHNRIIAAFGSSAVETSTARIRHNEGNLQLASLLKKKFYYGQHIRSYYKKKHNSAAFRKQANIFSRITIICWPLKKVLSHPILAIGTLWMIGTEFIAGGIGHLVGIHFKKPI